MRSGDSQCHARYDCRYVVGREADPAHPNVSGTTPILPSSTLLSKCNYCHKRKELGRVLLVESRVIAALKLEGMAGQINCMAFLIVIVPKQ